MSSSLDEEAGLLFGVTADNLICFITGHDHLDLKLEAGFSSFKLHHHLPFFSQTSTLIGGTSQRNPAILSQSRSLSRRDRKKRRKEQLKIVKNWVNESEAGGARRLGLCKLHYNIQPLTSLFKPDCGDLSIPAPRLQLYFHCTGRAYNPMHLQLTESLC